MKINNIIIPTNLDIKIEEIINFMKGQNPLIIYEHDKNNDYVIKHIKYGGKLIITSNKKYKNGDRNIQFNC